MKSKIAKITAAAVFVLVLALCMSVGVSAEGEIGYGEAQIPRFASATRDTMALAANVNEQALDHLVRGYRECRDEINFYESGYRIRIGDRDALLQAGVFAAPDLFYVSNAYSYSFMESGNYVYLYAIYPQYTMTGSELAAAKAEYDSMISHITEQAEELDTDLEKALFYHEYIVANYEYDQDFGIYDSYNMLKQRKGVCQAYTLLYAELLLHEGIDNTAVLSNGLNHVWNAVEINGQWFLCDLTWDDPLYDVPGRIYHSYFLRSMGAFGHTLSGGGRDWVVTDGRTLSYSSAYDAAFWCSYEGWVHPYGSKVYYLSTDNDKTYVCNRTLASLGTESRMFSISSNLHVEGVYYPGELGFCGLGDKLYYAASSTHSRAYVYEYDLDDGSRTSVYTYSHSCSGGDCYRGILALMPDGDRIRFHDADYYDSYSGSGTIGYFEITKDILMDVNGDGAVTNSDISVYVRYLSGWQNVSFVAGNADVDKNGRYNNRDLVAIIRYVNG